MKKLLKLILANIFIINLFSFGVQAQTISEYNICLATENFSIWDPCPPWETVFYGRKCDNCCNGTTYDKYAWGNAKKCCETIWWNILLTNIYNEQICCPAKSTIYWPYWKDCCQWTPYNLAKNNKWWNYLASCCETPNIEYQGKCVKCEDCRDLYKDIISALAKAKWQMEDQTDFPTQAEIDKFQVEILDLVNTYRETKNCDDAFKDDYSTCPWEEEQEDDDSNSSSTADYDMWIYCPPDKMVAGQCKFDVYDTIWIRQSEWETSVWIFVQDIILSATMFIGTVITIAIIVSWLLFVFWWAKPDLQAKAKKWLTNAVIWLVLVLSSYTIIRLIQYLIKWD